MKPNTIFKNLFFYFFIVLMLSGCEPVEDESSDGQPGFLDTQSLSLQCYVKNANTGLGIPGAVVNWQRVGNWPGAIVYPTSGTTNNDGYFDVSFEVPSNITSYTLNIISATVPSGHYVGWHDGTSVILRQNSTAVLNINLYPL